MNRSQYSINNDEGPRSQQTNQNRLQSFKMDLNNSLCIPTLFDFFALKNKKIVDKKNIHRLL